MFVGCTAGLEPVLAEELTALKFTPRMVGGGAEVDGPDGSFQLLNLWSRIGSRVLLRVAEVSSVSQLKNLDLRAYGSAFEVDAFGENAGDWGVARPSTPGAVKLVVRGLKHGRAQVSIDTTGELLHFRGYRQEVGRAPMRETLASAVLRFAKWQPGEPLWDVMCGSGTMLIEAAEQSAGLAAGRNRHFAFESFPSHDVAAWQSIARQHEAVKTELIGSDLNSGALGTARRNAKRAGIFELLKLERIDATKLEPRGERGVVIANLPYGKRVGERDELGTLYRAFGKSLTRACPGWFFAFLLQDGSDAIGLKVEERHRVSNGGLECEIILGQVA